MSICNPFSNAADGPKDKQDVQVIFAWLLSGCADASLSFEDLRGLLTFLKFEERVRGDHHIFYHTGMVEILNLQPRNGDAKPYQVKQVRNLILKYKLGLPYDDTL